MNSRLPPRPSVARGWPLSGLPLAFWGARHHPDVAARGEIATALASWAGTDRDALLLDDSVWELPAYRSSPIAPMTIETADVADAAALAKLLFSQRIGGSRVRIASRDALLGQYGVTVTAANRAYASGRDLARPPRRAKLPVACLQPLDVPKVNVRTTVHGPEAARARGVVDESGISISIRGVRWPQTWSSFAIGLETESTVNTPDGRSISLGKIGLATTAENQALLVRPRSSEATMRLSALMALGSLLVLNARGHDGGAATQVVIRLQPPTETGTPFACVASDSVPETDAWLRIAWPGEPILPLEVRLVLARHLPVHIHWLDAPLAAAVLSSTIPQASA